jgi:hypothetical protein
VILFGTFKRVCADSEKGEKIMLSSPQVQESVVSLLHEILIPLNGIESASAFLLQNNIPDEILPQLKTVNEVSKKVLKEIKYIYSNPKESFDFASPQKVIRQLHERFSTWKEDEIQISSSVFQIHKEIELDYKLADSKLEVILHALIVESDKFQRIFKYLYSIEEENLNDWDVNRILGKDKT